MIDLHTHTLLSDGELIPSELARRAEAKGYRALGLADHVDSSNMEEVVPRLVKVAAELAPHTSMTIVPAAELTHVPPAMISTLVRRVRELGAAYVVVHGETPVEPVAAGTNRAAIEAGADILAHPGLITPEEVRLARKNGILLEITTRSGHSLTNGHVARLAKEEGATLIINTDTHAPRDLVSLDLARTVVLGTGLTVEDFAAMRAAAEAFLARLGRPVRMR